MLLLILNLKKKVYIKILLGYIKAKTILKLNKALYKL